MPPRREIIGSLQDGQYHWHRLSKRRCRKETTASEPRATAHPAPKNTGARKPGHPSAEPRPIRPAPPKIPPGTPSPAFHPRLSSRPCRYAATEVARSSRVSASNFSSLLCSSPGEFTTAGVDLWSLASMSFAELSDVRLGDYSSARDSRTHIRYYV